MKSSKISGIGAALPDRVITNNDLKKWMDTSDEWITQRTGISERRWAEENIASSDLGYQASLLALSKAGVAASDIDLIVFSTSTPDYTFPGTGCILAAKLGLKNTPALDIRQQCTGFIYGLSICDQYIRTGMYRHILLVGAEVHSKGLDISTRGRDVSVLFGDGAAAVVLSATDSKDLSTESHIYSTHLHADGHFANELCAIAPGTAKIGSEWISKEDLAEGLQYPKMNGKKVFVHATTKMSEAIVECLSKNGKQIRDVEYFFFHQANRRIEQAIIERLKAPDEKVISTIHKYGNTTAASIPLGLYEAEQRNLLKRGQLIALAAFGSGFTWGSALLRY